MRLAFLPSFASLISISLVLVNVLQAHVSLKRIDEFLNEQETAKYSVLRAPSTASDPVVGFVDGCFTWSDEQLAKTDPTTFRIKDLNLNFPVGHLSIILGPGASLPPLCHSDRTNSLDSQSAAANPPL